MNRYHLTCMTLLAALLLTSLPSCTGMSEGMDSAWRSIDPAGHRRYHRDKYYPNERRTGLRLPKEE